MWLFRERRSVQKATAPLQEVSAPAPAETAPASNSQPQAPEDALREALSCAAGLRKRAAGLAARGVSREVREAAEAELHAGKAAIASAEAALSVEEKPPGEIDNKQLRRLTRQRLQEGLAAASKQLEAAWKQFQSAELRASTSGSLDLEAPESWEARKAPLLQVEATASVADLHAASVDDFARDVAAVAQSVQGVQRALVDLAAHAQAQGEVLDSIEISVSEVEHNTTGATEQLQITSRSQEQTFSRLLVAVLLAVLLALITSVTAAHRSGYL